MINVNVRVNPNPMVFFIGTCIWIRTTMGTIIHIFIVYCMKTNGPKADIQKLL